MCKLFGVSSVAGWNRKKLNAALFAAQTAFSGEKDGFGYAVRTSRGLYGERYVNPKDFSGVEGAKSLSKYLEQIKSAIEFEADVKGRMGKLTGGLIVHGRTSTNNLDVENTHPFIKKGWALAHNGIVDYDGPHRHKRGECDSEDILNSFVYGSGLKELGEHYTGYGAVLVMPPKWGFIAYRDAKAPLYVCRLIKGEGDHAGEGCAYAFATSPVHLLAILKKAEVRHTRPMRMKDEHAVIIKGDKVTAAVKVEEHEGPGHRVSSFAETKATGVPSYAGSPSTYNGGHGALTKYTPSRHSNYGTQTGGAGSSIVSNHKQSKPSQSTFDAEDWSGYSPDYQ
jgi:hypothetical protein